MSRRSVDQAPDLIDTTGRTENLPCGEPFLHFLTQTPILFDQLLLLFFEVHQLSRVFQCDGGLCGECFHELIVLSFESAVPLVQNLKDTDDHIPVVSNGHAEDVASPEACQRVDAGIKQRGVCKRRPQSSSCRFFITAPAMPMRASNRMTSEVPRATFAQSSDFFSSNRKIVARSASISLAASLAMMFNKLSKFFSELIRWQMSSNVTKRSMMRCGA